MNFKYPDEVIQKAIPIVARLTEKFTNKESTSVSYDTARQLMNAVLYCLRESDQNCDVEGSNAMSNTDKFIDIEAHYQCGCHLVIKKVMKTKCIYNEIIPVFKSYGNVSYYETVIKGMPVFFERYDPRFNPQNHILTLDYPLILEVTDRCGIDLIYQYLVVIKLEQEFLSLLPQNYIMEVLDSYHSECASLFINVCSIILHDVLARMIVGKSIAAKKLDRNDYQVLKKFVADISQPELEKKLICLIMILVERGYQKNQSLLEYLKADARNFSFELLNATKHNNLEVVFVTGM